MASKSGGLIIYRLHILSTVDGFGSHAPATPFCSRVRYVMPALPAARRINEYREEGVLSHCRERGSPPSSGLLKDFSLGRAAVAAKLAISGGARRAGFRFRAKWRADGARELFERRGLRRRIVRLWRLRTAPILPVWAPCAIDACPRGNTSVKKAGRLGQCWSSASFEILRIHLKIRMSPCLNGCSSPIP